MAIFFWKPRYRWAIRGTPVPSTRARIGPASSFPDSLAQGRRAMEPRRNVTPPARDIPPPRLALRQRSDAGCHPGVCVDAHVHRIREDRVVRRGGEGYIRPGQALRDLPGRFQGPGGGRRSRARGPAIRQRQDDTDLRALRCVCALVRKAGLARRPFLPRRGARRRRPGSAAQDPPRLGEHGPARVSQAGQGPRILNPARGPAQPAGRGPRFTSSVRGRIPHIQQHSFSWNLPHLSPPRTPCAYQQQDPSRAAPVPGWGLCPGLSRRCSWPHASYQAGAWPALAGAASTRSARAR